MQKNKVKGLVAVLCSALVMGAISFIVTLKVYDEKYSKGNFEEKQNFEIAKKDSIVELKNYNEQDNVSEINENNELTDLSETAITDVAVSTTEEYLEEIDVPTISEEEYLAFISENFNENVEQEIEEVNSNNEENNIIEASAGIENKKIEFVKPLEGKVGMNYSSEKLIYSNTLEEWITHTGIDIIGEEAMPVKAIADGVVESIKMDPRYGNTIIIKHNDEYTSIYSNLSTSDLVYVGKKVKIGEIISGVGKGFGFENKEEPHIHLEILKNGEYVNPQEFINL